MQADLTGRALRDATVATAVAALLFLPFIGFRLVDYAGGEGIGTRWHVFALTVALIFLGSLVLSLIEAGWYLAPLILMIAFDTVDFFLPWPSDFLQAAAFLGAAALALRAGYLMRRKDVDVFVKAAGPPAGKWLPWVLLAFAVALPFMPFSNRGVLDVGIVILTYILLGWGLNIVTGLAGLLDLGYAAFYAIGAYSAGILAVNFGFSFWACLPMAAISAAVAGIVLGFPVLGLRGDYFAIVTLGFGEIVRIVANNWRSLTNGSQGLSGAPRPDFFGIADFTASAAPGRTSFADLFGVPYSPLQRVEFLYYLILAVALLVNLLTLRLRRLPISRAWEALREDEIAAAALGIDRRRMKLAAFAIGAASGGIAGAFFAARQGFITPESFGFTESVAVTAIVVLGGMGSQLGIVLAALLFAGLPELFRPFAEYRMLAFGFFAIVIMRFRPQGLIATRKPSAILE
ncbi:MAG TPA: high-affinity branched-chain amino acid ABC transporter permease LivM [Alphaproteobacteria bacterium]|nr:high-affinity branched-chain amino acid ABC transporter permease LivM [Alphaproteobacteria bacterium]